MEFVLAAGLWLDGSVWADVVSALERRGHRAHALTLPGQGDANTSATLADQVDAVVAAVDAAEEPPVVVGHSAACGLAWLAADARPDRIAAVVLIGGFPAEDGTRYAAVFEVTDGLMHFPGWAPFEGPDAVDLDEPTRKQLAATAIPVPEGVAYAVVHLTDERRFGVPVVVICPEFSPEQARAWIDAGDAAELGKVERLELVDIDSGHWPMITQPERLAELLATVAKGAGRAV